MPALIQSHPIPFCVQDYTAADQTCDLPTLLHKSHASLPSEKIFNQRSLSALLFSRERPKMPDTASRFIEILDPEVDHPRFSESDVRLEDVLADHEASVRRSRSSTQSSNRSQGGLDNRRRSDRDDHVSPPSPRLKRFSRRFILVGR